MQIICERCGEVVDPSDSDSAAAVCARCKISEEKDETERTAPSDFAGLESKIEPGFIVYLCGLLLMIAGSVPVAIMAWRIAAAHNGVVWLIVFVGVWIVLEGLVVFLSILLGTLLGLGIEAIWRSIRS